jgi:hypothetical protein
LERKAFNQESRNVLALGSSVATFYWFIAVLFSIHQAAIKLLMTAATNFTPHVAKGPPNQLKSTRNVSFCPEIHYLRIKMFGLFQKVFIGQKNVNI